AWPGLVIGAGGPLGKAVLAGPEIRAAIANASPLGRIWDIRSCGRGLKRTCSLSTSWASVDEDTSGKKRVVACFSGNKAPALARFSDCKFVVIVSPCANCGDVRCSQMG